MKSILFICSTLVLSAVGQNLRNLRVVAEWTQPEFGFPTEADRKSALDNRQYIPGNAVPIDMDVDYRERAPSRVFVTFPRFQDGVPITFGTLTNERRDGGPVVQPYPDYSWHSSHGQDCDGLTSVFRVKVSIYKYNAFKY